MSQDKRGNFSGWLYKLCASILFVLSIVALLAFIRALVNTECEKDEKTLADSLQIEELRQDVKVVNQKVDSILRLLNKKPKVVYKYMKPHKDTVVVELNVHDK